MPPKFDRSKLKNLRDTDYARQRWWNYRFALYREHGLAVHHDLKELDPQDARRFAQVGLALVDVTNFPIPKPGVYRGLNRPPGQGLAFDPYPVLVNNQIPNQRPPTPKFEAARKLLKAKLRIRGLRDAGLIGSGGNGMVVLVGPRGSPRVLAVAKGPATTKTKRAGPAAIIEKRMTDQFAGALHVVQTLPMPGLPSVRIGTRLRPPRIPHLSPARYAEDIIMLEYIQRGSLHKALENIHRAATSPNPNRRTDLSLGNRQLWHIFHCLVKSLIAVAYPPTSEQCRHAYQDNPEPPFKEKIVSGVDKNPVVHLDIDPQNILVGESDGQLGHGIMPRMILSDFGIARTLRPNVMTNFRRLRNMRRLAKPLFHVPEQFTEEWDYLPFQGGPNDNTRRHSLDVAGNYGWRSNLFQVGLVMLCLMTRHHPPRIPHPSKIRVPPLFAGDRDDDDRPAPVVGQVAQRPRNPGGDVVPLPVWAVDEDARVLRGPEDGFPGWRRVWSYGGYILNDGNAGYRRFDRTLRLMIAWCLCDDPYYRPRLRALERYIKLMLGNVVQCPNEDDENTGPRPGNQEDADLVQWVTNVFDRPAEYWA